VGFPNDLKVVESRRYTPDCQAAADIARETLTVAAGQERIAEGKLPVFLPQWAVFIGAKWKKFE
jgi:hypothetical protein